MLLLSSVQNARVVELVDSLASGASAHSGRAGSTPASRTIKDYSPEVISALVEDIVDDKIEHGQMNHAELTFRDIETVKMFFKQKLQNIYHTRIEYPKNA